MEQRFTRAALAAAMAAALAACGGGGGGAAADPQAAMNTPAPALASASGPGATSGTSTPAPDAAGAAPAASAPPAAPAPVAVAAAPAATPAAPPAAVPAAAGAPAPAAAPSDFIVHAATAGAQDSAAVALLAGGGHVAVWTSGSGTDGRQVRLQRFDAAGARAGAEVVLAEFAFSPGVAALADGGFVASWTRSQYQYEATGQAQRFDAAGNPAGAPITLAEAYFAYTARPAALPDGGFVVAIDSTTGRYGTNYGALARYRADGTLAGPAVTLNADLNDSSTSVFETSAIALADGRVAAAWIVSAGGTRQLALRLFDAGGAPLAPVATLASASHVGAPALAALADGFVLAWEQATAQGGRQVLVERFDGRGASLGRQVVATDAAANVMRPELTALPGGGFALAWHATRYGATTLERQAFLQRFDGAGAAVGAAQALNTIAVELASSNVFNDSLAVAPAGDGRVLVLVGDWSAATSWDVRGLRR